MARLNSRWVLAIKSKVRARRDRIANSAPSSNQFISRLTFSKFIFATRQLGRSGPSLSRLERTRRGSRSHQADADFTQMPVNRAPESTSRKRLGSTLSCLQVSTDQCLRSRTATATRGIRSSTLRSCRRRRRCGGSRNHEFRYYLRGIIFRLYGVNVPDMFGLF